MNDRPPERLEALLDLAGELVARIFGPEDDLQEVRIDPRTMAMRIITDHGGRITIDQEPSLN